MIWEVQSANSRDNMALYLGSLTRLTSFNPVGDVFVHSRPNQSINQSINQSSLFPDQHVQK